jgi:DNA modification methylase
MSKKIDGIGDLVPDRKNANRGTVRGLGMVEDSLRQYGAGRSILVDKDGVVIAGNKTLEVAADLGLPVKVVRTNGQELVVVQREDLDLDGGDGKARELAYADNRSSQVGLDWDLERILADVNEGVDLSGLWGEEELKELLKGVAPEPPADPGPQVDRAEELREKWQTERGQIWEVGRHRLMCGDSTSEEDVGRLLGDARPRLMITDPPYGVEYDPEWRNEAAAQGKLAYAARRVGTVPFDDRVDWSEAYSLFPGDVLYTWSPGGDHVILTGQAVQAAGFEIRNQIIWRKPHFPISRGHYTYQHEPCWYAVKKGRQAHWIGPANASTVWEVALDLNVEGGHSTQKPVACFAIPLANHDGDLYEPFIGSGTGMVAAEQLNRMCYAMDIERKYVAITLERMAGMGLEPRLVSTKATNG